MLGAPAGYVSGGPTNPRPTKRPRNLSVSGGASQISGMTLPVQDQANGMSMPGDSNRGGQVDGHGATTGQAKSRVEDKNNRKLSCKECRRLKLKCDRNFPCQSCVKRGCGSLCPEGALTSGRGSRFILANTEQLHDKIFELSDRVRQLEEALQSMNSRHSNQSHPLLAPELLKIKTSQELYGSGPPHNTPSISGPSSSDLGLQSKADRLPESVVALSINSESRDRPTHIMPPDYVTSRDSSPPEVGPDILQLSATFPFPWTVDLKIRKRIQEALPPRAEAQRLCEEARNNALWQFNIDASETFLPNLVRYCYNTPVESLSPRRLALLLMYLSIGSIVDLDQELGSLHGEAYHHLARAAVCEIPLMEEPDFDVLHCLFFMMWYHLIFSDNKKAVGYAWNLMGFVAKLAQGLGLHRDSPRLKGIPEEHEKRRAIFWELLNMDARMSLSLGRPPSICLTHVDTKPPICIGPGLYVPREEIVYHEWKNRYFIQCLTPMLEAVVATQVPDYRRIMELDGSVRDFGVPAILEENNPRDVIPRFLAMQRGLVMMSREIALLQLHRKYFTAAMSDPGVFELHHQYAPSVLATYLAAASLISTVETLYGQEARLSVRFLYLWFNSFSAVVTMSLLISRAPSTSLAVYALQDMERGCRLFRAAATTLPFSAKALPIMQKLVERCRRILQQSHEPENTQLTFNARHQLHISLPNFKGVHSTIYQCAERLAINSNPQTNGMECSPNTSLTSDHSHDQHGTWLPDIYNFSSLGVNVEDRYTFASLLPTPFVPSSPRVAEGESFNFDYGALTTDLVEETSYMAWF